MAFDLGFSAAKQALQADARCFACAQSSTVAACCLHLPTPQARFAATRPIDEAAIAAGLLQPLIPQPFDGANLGVRRRQLHDLLRAGDPA